MNVKWKLLLVTAGCLLSCASLAQVTLSGVRYEAGAELRGGAKVQLNGAGIRYRGPFKVYTAGLYLGRKSAMPEEVLAAAGPKRLAVTMLRDIDASELGKLFVRSVEDNMDRASFSRLIPGLMRMSQIFTDHKKLAAGDGFTIDWVPGVGTVISVRGVPQGEPFREPEFFTALMRIWIGPVPADWQLKEQLLGRPAQG
ncbi:hypothetical protein FN976_27260 [Caenimonas sedimenti]|uniref:Chalcone isomerase domain-containing protein n=1 Tax=Caenimonas sedimenti TaxID=2596921 RepID=A0A562ZEN7_9BURK|nr:chalcone isomerase family protein [Caenimonas sedimenti]TWO65508.1 hypothetical protein FN976_27260 [Caenimonas sedimenti]